MLIIFSLSRQESYAQIPRGKERDKNENENNSIESTETFDRQEKQTMNSHGYTRTIRGKHQEKCW